MTLSVWRYAHLVLAILSALFLFILSVTGVILAIGAVDDRANNHKVDRFDEIDLSQTIPVLWEVYSEITELTVAHNGSVAIDALDQEGNAVKAYIDPRSGEVLGEIVPKSNFIQWNTALHRSLFLKETGRIIVGVVSFLLFLITITGIILIAKRQQGLRNFFAKINRDFFAQYFHVVTGRIFLLPVLIVALTGTYLFMARIGLTGGESRTAQHEGPEEEGKAEQVALADFPVFRQVRLADAEKIEFPFMPDDPEEFYVLKLRDREITVSQITGGIVQETRYPYGLVLEKLSLDLHTGRTNIVWAIVLAFASLNMLFFMYTGFAITLRRGATKVKNKFPAAAAEYLVLVGTENGSTLAYANNVHQQLLAGGHKSFLTEMNRFASFPKIRHLLVFTSTYGLGTAPANAVRFDELLAKFPQGQPISYSVLGFGSKAYPDFCAYAQHIDRKLEQQPWAARHIDLHTVNDRSVADLMAWVGAWNAKSPAELSTTPAVYATKVAGLRKFTVLEKGEVTADNSTFRILIRPKTAQAFQSGDLLAIYPAGADGPERLYSIGKKDGGIQLMVKLHPNGLGSEYLYRLAEGEGIAARIVPNAGFHFPKKAPAVAMVANGTGIAPFLGMIAENKKRVPVRLYAGFRRDNDLSRQYRRFAEEETATGRLSGFRMAFSREENPQYVMDIIRQDTEYFSNLLQNKGFVMICGSRAMQRDVEKILAEIHPDLEKGQVLTDCY